MTTFSEAFDHAAAQLEVARPRILCLYVSLPEEISKVTLQSIRDQTLPVSKLVFVTKRSKKPTLGARVSEVINETLAKEDLMRYDYLLVVHSDNILPSNFLEANLLVEPDIMGFGSPQIIKIATFLKLMGGRLHPEQDDFYIRHKFAVCGFPASAPVVKAGLKRVTGTTHEIVKYNMDCGELGYKAGFEPIHVLFNLHFGLVRNFWFLIGYFKALILRKPLFDTALHMRRIHFATLLNPHKILGRVLRKAKTGFQPAWLQGPQVLQLDTHNLCNENCVYCNVEFLCGGKYGFMPLHVFRRVVSEMRGVKHVKLFLNGDALLETRLHDLAEIVKEISPSSNVVVYTNGAEFENRGLLCDRNLDEVHFTVSANTPETYEKVHGKPYFAKVLKTISWLAANKFANQKIVIRYVTVPQNVAEISGWKKRFEAFETVVTPLHCGYEQKASANLLESNSEVHKLSSRLDKYPDDLPCGCWNNLAISWDGRLLQCCDSPYKVNYGRVGEVSLRVAWQRRLENKMNNPACKACNLKNPHWREILDRYVVVSYYTNLLGDPM